MKKRLAQLLTVLMVLTGITVIVASPASASFGECTGGAVCTWRDPNYLGGMYYYTTPANTCVEIGGSWDNAISSIANRFSQDVIFYADHGCSGSNVALSAHCLCSSDHIGWLGLVMNNRISSFYRF